MAAMESLTALLTALLLYLFGSHMENDRRKRAGQQAGPLLRRFVRGRYLIGWIGMISILAPIVWLLIHLDWINWNSWFGSMMVFNVATLVLQFNPNSFWWRQVVEFHEWGILRFNSGKRIFTPWKSIDYCRWTNVPGALRIVTHDSTYILPKGSIRPGEIEAADAILRSHVKLADAERRVLNPEFKAAEQPTGLDLDDLNRRCFQFDLRTLLFFFVVASSAMSWYSIHFRRDREEKASLAQLDRFKPKIWGVGFDLQLDFSASPLKPHDSDLEVILEAFSIGVAGSVRVACDRCRF